MKTINQTVKFACSTLVALSLSAVLVSGSSAVGRQQYGISSARIDNSGSVQNYKSMRLAGNAMVPGIETIPIRMSTPAVVVLPGQSFTCSVTVESVPTGGGYIQIDCDTPGALANSSQNWPLSVYFAPGSSTTTTFNLTANSSITNATTVNMSYGTSSADPNNPPIGLRVAPFRLSPLLDRRVLRLVNARRHEATVRRRSSGLRRMRGERPDAITWGMEQA